MQSIKWASLAFAFIWFVVFMSYHGEKISPETAAKLKAQFDQEMAIYDPLCIYEGPFPKSVDYLCGACKQLTQAGLIEASQGQMQLTAFGKRVYANDADTRMLDALEAKNSATKRSFDRSKLFYRSRPRFCFGETYADSLVDALSSQQLNSASYQSAKFIPGVRNPHSDLFDPRLAALEFSCVKPEAGKPVLCAQKLVTFETFYTGEVEISNLRYGRWVNEN